MKTKPFAPKNRVLNPFINRFSWAEDFEVAQSLADVQLRTDWVARCEELPDHASLRSIWTIAVQGVKSCFTLSCAFLRQSAIRRVSDE
jgi:hypothetical protein